MGIFGKLIGNLLGKKLKDREKGELIGDAVDKVEDFIDKKTHDASDSFAKDKTTRKGKKITKHQINFTGTTAIISYALYSMYEANTITTESIIVLIIGVVYSAVMFYLDHRSKKKSNEGDYNIGA